MQITIYANIRKDLVGNPVFMYSRVESPTTRYKLYDVPRVSGFSDSAYYLRRMLGKTEANLYSLVDDMGTEMYDPLLPNTVEIEVNYDKDKNIFTDIYSVVVYYGLKFKGTELTNEVKNTLLKDMNNDITRKERVFL